MEEHFPTLARFVFCFRLRFFDFADEQAGLPHEQAAGFKVEPRLGETPRLTSLAADEILRFDEIICFP